jgi:hypothetical protein
MRRRLAIKASLAGGALQKGTDMQKAWALVLVNRNDWVLSHTVRYRRSDVIDRVLTEYSNLRERRYPGLTDAQFWRKLKRKYGCSVRKIELRVK